MECYLKGNRMTFEMEEEDRECIEDIKYLLPKETVNIQRIVEDACDKMEYDGSIMYDLCPDKVSVENMAKNLAKKHNHGQMENEENRDYVMKIQMLLCVEFLYRRQRRKMFKDNLEASNLVKTDKFPV